MIKQRPLRDKVHEQLLQRIYHGEISPTTALRDVAIAAELGVSRTPVREALVRLAREGIVEARLGRGFRLRPLDSDTVRNSYPILWALERLALNSSGGVSPSHLAELRSVNAAMAGAAAPQRRLELDHEWHVLLLAECGNAPLLEMIETLKAKLLRYEYAYMQDAGRAGASVGYHDRIIVALAEGDLASAGEWLERNWHYGMEQLLDWLESTPVDVEGTPALEAAG